MREQLFSKAFLGPHYWEIEEAEGAERGEAGDEENEKMPDGSVKPKKKSRLPWGYKFFGDWLPRLRYCNAVLLLVINIFLPGIGTLFFSLAWLSGEDFAVPTTMKPRWQIASIGILYGFAQFILFPFLVGWAWAILTGIIALKQARWVEFIEKSEKRKKENMSKIEEEDENKAPGGDTENGGASTSNDNDDNEKKAAAANKAVWKPHKAPTPPPDSPPPGWVYRLYPYASDQLKGPDGSLGKPPSRHNNNSRSNSRASNGRTSRNNSSMRRSKDNTSPAVRQQIVTPRSERGQSGTTPRRSPVVGPAPKQKTPAPSQQRKVSVIDVTPASTSNENNKSENKNENKI